MRWCWKCGYQRETECNSAECPMSQATFNGPREALLNLIAESKVWPVGEFEHVTDLIIKELWLRGYKLVQVDGQD